MSADVFFSLRQTKFFLTALLVSLLTTLPAAENALAQGKASEGKPLPAFSATDMDNNSIDSSKYAGKVLLLDFWALNCGSCMEEMPHIINLYKKYNAQGFEVIGIEIERLKSKTVKARLKSKGITIPFPNIIDNKMELMRLHGVGMLPTTILVDTEGTVDIFHVGYKPGFEIQLEEEIKKLLPAQ